MHRFLELKFSIVFLYIAFTGTLLALPVKADSSNQLSWQEIGQQIHSARKCRFVGYTKRLGYFHKKINAELTGQNRKAYTTGYKSAVKMPLACDDIPLETLLLKLTSYEENGLTDNPVSSELSNRLQNSTTVEVQQLGDYSDVAICHLSIDDKGRWEKSRSLLKFVNEAERRGLSCGVTPKPSSQASINDGEVAALPTEINVPIFEEYRRVTIRVGESFFESVIGINYLTTASGSRSKGVLIFGGDFCDTEVVVSNQIKFFVRCPSGYRAEGTIKPLGTGKGELGEGEDNLGNVVQYRLHPSKGKNAVTRSRYVELWKANLVTGKQDSIFTANQSVNSVQSERMSPNSQAAGLVAAKKRADELEQRLAALEAEKELAHRTVASDIEAPIIRIFSAKADGPQGLVHGQVTDNSGVAEVRIEGQALAMDASGGFTAKTYVPEGGVSVTIEAFDLAGLSSSMSVRLDRAVTTSTAVLDFDRLNPVARKAVNNPNALALIIGLEQYEKTDAKAAYADADASVFADYAALKLGVPKKRIKTLLNEGADISDVLLSVQDWLSRAIKQEQSDVYVFFAGHGLASDDGEKMYLLPYDGSPRLLSRTALLRDELFSDIATANPRSVTVFLDTCYSGTTRGPDMLIASRPIAIRAKERAVPEGFTVMTAAAGDQTAKPLEEAKHGMFSYFLMKGMEGDADANSDNQITSGELQEYVYQNVVQQSSGSQTPELQGDADRVLVRFQ